MLGILKIKSLKRVDSKFKAANIQSDLWEACKIINRHLKSGRRLSKCKEELIEAGLKEFARL
jgi:hypothetical protein